MTQEKQNLMDEGAWRNRIEAKLDSISEALITLARVEEKIVFLESRRQEEDATLRKQIENIIELRQATTKNTELLTILYRIMWGVGGIVATLVITQLVKLMV